MVRRSPAGWKTWRALSAVRRDTSPILALPFPRLPAPRSLTAKMSADFLRRRSNHGTEKPNGCVGMGVECIATR